MCEITSLRWSLELSASWQSLGIPGPCNCSDALPLSSLVPASRPCKRNFQKLLSCGISHDQIGKRDSILYIIQLRLYSIIPGLTSRVSVWNYVCNGCAWNCFWCGARCACYSVLYPPLVSLPLSTPMYAASWHYFYQLTLLHSESTQEKIHIYMTNSYLTHTHMNIIF